jgi:Prolipoprotein diacylglyceryl transferase
MNFVLTIIIFCFFIFLYFLFYLSRDDFVITRKDISLERVFNLTILASLVCLFFARFFYIFFNPKPEYFNPLVFFAIPYFHGLSFLGGVVGGSVFTYFYTKVKKMPFGRIFDLMVMSIIGVMPIGYFMGFIISLGKTSLIYNIIFIFSIVIFFLFSKIIFSFSSKGEIKDGSLGLIFISLYSFIYFTARLFLNVKTFSFLAPENIFILIVMFSTLVLILNKEIIDKYLSKK